MTPRHKQRMMFVGFILAGISIATVLMVTAFQENLLYFYTPTQVAGGEAPLNHSFRLGGLVQKNSVHRTPDTLDVNFVITDNAKHITVKYNGILPDLFREGQGIIARGKLGANGIFSADEVLAKHDENYMPPEVSAALKTAQTSKKPDNNAVSVEAVAQ